VEADAAVHKTNKDDALQYQPTNNDPVTNLDVFWVCEQSAACRLNIEAEPISEDENASAPAR
jgi:hypothetical protein